MKTDKITDDQHLQQHFLISQIKTKICHLVETISRVHTVNVPVNCVSLGLCRVLNVRLIQQLLDAQQDLKSTIPMLLNHSQGGTETTQIH